MRPVRHHLGIRAFGTNAWTAAKVGDRLMPEHEEDPGSEELYVVLRGHARFEVDGESVDAPSGTLVFVEPETNRTAFAVEPDTAVIAVGSKVGKPYEVGGWEVWAEFHPAYDAGDYDDVIARGRVTLEAPATEHRSTTSPAARHCQGVARMRSSTCGPPSNDGRASATTRRRTPTSIRCGTSPRFGSSSARRRAASRPDPPSVVQVDDAVAEAAVDAVHERRRVSDPTPPSRMTAPGLPRVPPGHGGDDDRRPRGGDMANELQGKRIAILAAEMFERVELEEPRAGARGRGGERRGGLARAGRDPRRSTTSTRRASSRSTGRWPRRAPTTTTR